MSTILSFFRWPLLISAVLLVGVTVWGWTVGQGFTAGTLVAMLAVLEVSLSFDNAVVNAKVLTRMNELWQKRFLTWGIFVAVFGMRLVFPLAVVAIGSGIGPVEILDLAISRPEEYAHHLELAHPYISVFGGMFLLMVFLKFAIDESKDLHWLGAIESQLARLGKLEASEIAIAMGLLVFCIQLVEASMRTGLLLAGIGGLVTYILVDAIGNLLDQGEEDSDSGGALVSFTARAGFGAFLYLEVLDASFSFDGTIGAFAVTSNIFIITIGLGIGAFFIRSMTLWLLQQGTLAEYIFLEHGAHWAIGVLAVLMLVGIALPIPEALTALIGFFFIGLSVISSIQYRRKTVAPAAE